MSWLLSDGRVELTNDALTLLASSSVPVTGGSFTVDAGFVLAPNGALYCVGSGTVTLYAEGQRAQFSELHRSLACTTLGGTNQLTLCEPALTW
jgi:hypothetical protein